MGCLNSDKNFSHKFANIHLSGPCNRRCYFCIGQHMMALDSQNNLSKYPLRHLGAFSLLCLSQNITDINLTGTNTDPLLYKFHFQLTHFLRSIVTDVKLGIRTNGVGILSNLDDWNRYDHASISFPTFDKDKYNTIMGGTPPDLESIFKATDRKMSVKINIVLCPENLSDLGNTLKRLSDIGYTKVNLREPYGQPHLGDPYWHVPRENVDFKYGMPVYEIYGMEVMYWDVHYVEVESLNLYADGKISTDYPITRGHSEEFGLVQDQSNFKTSGRIREQWRQYEK